MPNIMSSPPRGKENSVIKEGTLVIVPVLSQIFLGTLVSPCLPFGL